MAQFIVKSEGVEVNGQTVLSIVAGMETFQEIALEILAGNGIADPKPNEWYDQQAWLNAFRQIAENVGEYTLYEIGKMIPQNADWPPQVNSVESALSSIDIAYHMNHRINGVVMFDPADGAMKDGIGNYRMSKITDTELCMVCDTPYPSAFDRGIVAAAADKFSRSEELIDVTLDPSKPNRINGAESCTYIVQIS